MDERIYQIGLSLLNGVTAADAKQLVDAIGSLEGVFHEKASNFRHFHGLNINPNKDLGREAALERAEEELDFMERNEVRMYFYQHANYPYLLKQCIDAPVVIFAMGNIDFGRKNISIVGTRKSSPYGKKMCDQLVKDLAPHQVQIISGLAHGIDKCAHEAAIKNNLPTIGVLGHGLDTMYPAAHRPLARQMLENGGVITEYISGTVGDPRNFPERNRIVAGLSQATVVVESSETGGSMITANLAHDYNREVFAFPGNADQEFSSGCNNLIKRSKAHLMTSASDLVNVLGWEEKTADQPIKINFEDLDEKESNLIQIMQSKGELDVDSLIAESNIEASSLSVHLFNLEMKGLVKMLPGKRYSLA